MVIDLRVHQVVCIMKGSVDILFSPFLFIFWGNGLSVTDALPPCSGGELREAIDREDNWIYHFIIIW